MQRQPRSSEVICAASLRCRLTCDASAVPRVLLGWIPTSHSDVSCIINLVGTVENVDTLIQIRNSLKLLRFLVYSLSFPMSVY